MRSALWSMGGIAGAPPSSGFSHMTGGCAGRILRSAHFLRKALHAGMSREEDKARDLSQTHTYPESPFNYAGLREFRWARR